MPLHDDSLFTTFVGNLHEKVTEELLYELFLQVGPLKNVCIPKNPVTGENKTFGFVTFRHEASVPYAIDMLQGVPMFGQCLNLKKRHARKDTTENNDTNVSPVEVDTNMYPQTRNDRESFSCAKELVGRFATNVFPRNAREFDYEPMDIRTSTPLHVKHFNATPRERKMRMDRDERSFNSPVAKDPKNLSYQSQYATPQRQIMRNSNSSMFLNRSESFGNCHSPIRPPQRVFHHGALMNDQRMSQRRPMYLHRNQPVGNVNHHRQNWNEQNVRMEEWHARHHPYKSHSFY